MKLTYKFLLVMLLGLVGMIVGILFFGVVVVRDTLQANLQIIAIVIPFTVFINGILFLFILQIIKPLEDLTKTSEHIAEGDFSKRINIHSKDEIGQLGSTFNNMAAKLQKTHQGLSETVTMKTGELANKIRELEAQHAKEKAIFESIGEGLVVTGNAGNIVFLNSNAQELLGLDKEESIGKNFINVLSLYDEKANPLPKENNPVALLLKKGTKVSGTFLLVKKNDEKIDIHMTSTPVILHDNSVNTDTVIGCITIIRDSTKELELDRMRTEFISLASHQLRTPLTSIKWFTEMLMGNYTGTLNTEQIELAQNIYDSTARMIELVSALLNISRIESGKIVLTPRNISLKELVEAIIKDLKVQIDAKKQVLTIVIQEDLPKVFVDPQLIQQVYMNLLSNASKYSPEGGNITISIVRKGNEIISQISDNGYGVPKFQQHKIFQKFFRADNVVIKEAEGTGLGLYLVKIVIESSKGKIWFESHTANEGNVPSDKHGTTFWFSLPLTDETEQSNMGTDNH